MAHLARNTHQVPAPLLAAARAALEAHGPRKGAELLGISRNALTGIVATGHAMAGTIALLREKSAQKAA